ncbi:MAG: fluoride efflux transporter CrcB [bacterium]|nr:fluoride efflux transporter CrcB [bacterium]
MMKVLMIAAAGLVGTLARYGLGGLVQKQVDSLFPLGTVVVNVLGCLLFGILWSWAENRITVDATIRAAIFIGFFGAFTTFSSFAYETVALMRESQWFAAGANILLQNLLGMAGLFGGLIVGRKLF